MDKTAIIFGEEYKLIAIHYEYWKPSDVGSKEDKRIIIRMPEASQ